MTDLATLQAVAETAQRHAERRARVQASAQAWIEEQMQVADRELDEAVIKAIEDGHSKTDVARAYTVSGKTPNRNAIHDIVNRSTSIMETWAGEYPFKWKSRRVTTASGKRTVYDIVAKAEAFGPDEVTGDFTWKFDISTGATDPVLTDTDPYPTSKFYVTALSRWLMTHPYPGSEQV